MTDVLLVLMRWLHITSMATLIGGFLYARLVFMPAVSALAPDAGEALAARTANTFRPLVLTGVSGLIVSGLYSILTNPGHSPRYHMLLGIKLLLALHVFASVFLATKPHHPRRARLMSGAVISGLTILAISAYLRRIF
jgi:hypothetical protein